MLSGSSHCAFKITSGFLYYLLKVSNRLVCMFRRDLRLEPKYHLRPLFNLPVAILQVNVEISWQTFQVNDVTITLNPGNEINAMIVCFQDSPESLLEWLAFLPVDSLCTSDTDYGGTAGLAWTP